MGRLVAVVAFVVLQCQRVRPCFGLYKPLGVGLCKVVDCYGVETKFVYCNLCLRLFSKGSEACGHYEGCGGKRNRRKYIFYGDELQRLYIAIADYVHCKGTHPSVGCLAADSAMSESSITTVIMCLWQKQLTLAGYSLRQLPALL